MRRTNARRKRVVKVKIAQLYGMGVHIGKIIQAFVKSSGMPVTEFADKINCSRRNVYEIFERSTIDTGQLEKISKVLGRNLFMHYVTDADIALRKTKEAELVKALEKFLDAIKADAAKQKKKRA